MFWKLKDEREAIDLYLQSNTVDDFVYDGMVGFEAFNIFTIYNEAWFLEFMMAFFDKKININTPWPKLPQTV